MFKVCVIGSGHVGLVTAACLAELGNHVVAVDKSRSLIDTLSMGSVPFYEENLELLVKEGIENGRLSFTCDLHKAVQESEIIFICVDTPTLSDGQSNLSSVFNVYRECENATDKEKFIVIKSTVPPGTAKSLTPKSFDIISNPEFLRQGKGVYDFMNPDRIVVGTESESAWHTMMELYEPFAEKDIPIISTDHETAELAKQAANTFLGVKISFINEMAHICARTGANVEKLAEIIGSDARIGPQLLKPGPGFGGPCLVKDIHSLMHTAAKHKCSSQMAYSAMQVNELIQPEEILERMPNKPQNIAVFGLTFKANTDSTERSPALTIIEEIQGADYSVLAYDPMAKDIPEWITVVDDPYKACVAADMILILTEWPQFEYMRWIDIYNTMRDKYIFDTRNLLDPALMKKIGFEYMDNGRTPVNMGVQEEVEAHKCAGMEK